MIIKRIIKHIGRPFGLVLGSFYHYKPRPVIFDEMDQLDGLEIFPKISIVTPSYNQCKFLERTIKSVLNQNYPNLEYVIQDGGSTDGSVSIIEKYENDLKYWESREDNGQAHAINLGFQKTTGEIMAWLNSDDCLTPGTLKRVAKFFNDNPDVDVVYGNRIIIDEQSREVGRWCLPNHSKGAYCWRDYIPQETMFWRRSLWEKVGGGLDESYQFAMDWELIWRFSHYDAKFVRLPYFMGMFTTHCEQKSLAARESQGEQEFLQIREQYCKSCLSKNCYRILSACYLLSSVYWKAKAKVSL